MVFAGKYKWFHSVSNPTYSTQSHLPLKGESSPPLPVGTHCMCKVSGWVGALGQHLLFSLPQLLFLLHKGCVQGESWEKRVKEVLIWWWLSHDWHKHSVPLAETWSRASQSPWTRLDTGSPMSIPNTHTLFPLKNSFHAEHSRSSNFSLTCPQSLSLIP